MNLRASVLVLSAIVAMLGCKGSPPGTKATGGAPGAGASSPSGQVPPGQVPPGQGSPSGGVTSPAIDALIAGVPGNAIAIGFVDMDAPLWSFVTGGLLPLDEPTRKTLDAELREYVSRHVGLDLSRVQHAVAFVSGPPPRGAVLVKAIGGALKLPGATDQQGATIWPVDRNPGTSIAIKNDVLVFGVDEAVRDVLDTLGGARKSVATENKPLVDWLHEHTKGAAVGLAAIAPAGLPLPPPVTGVRRAAMSASRAGLRAVIDGEEATIAALQTMANQGIAEVLAETTRMHDAAIAGTLPPPEGVAAILSAAYMKSYADRLRPRRDGNRLSASLDVGLEGPQTMAIVSVVGIMAAVAVPAFVDYTRKARMIEAEPAPE